MSQISPPVRILLILTAALLGMYMLFLRPKPEEIPPLEPATTNTTTATPETASKATTEKAPAKAEAAAAEPAEDVKGLPKPVQKAIRRDKVVVLLFWNKRAADDRAVKSALDKVDDHDGRVFVDAAPIKEISRYGRIARGVNVEQSPTVVVADRDLRATTLVGYADRTTIDQAVTDALVNSNGLFTDAYLKAVDKVCVHHGAAIASVPGYWVDNAKEADARLARFDAAVGRFVADFKAIDAPKRHAAFHKAAVADLSAYGSAVHRESTALTAGAGTGVSTIVTNTRSQLKPLGQRINKRFNGEGLYRCGSQF